MSCFRLFVLFLLFLPIVLVSFFDLVRRTARIENFIHFRLVHLSVWLNYRGFKFFEKQVRSFQRKFFP